MISNCHQKEDLGLRESRASKTAYEELASSSRLVIQ